VGRVKLEPTKNKKNVCIIPRDITSFTRCSMMDVGEVLTDNS
jgi:hypothetical protein